MVYCIPLLSTSHGIPIYHCHSADRGRWYAFAIVQNTVYGTYHYHLVSWYLTESSHRSLIRCSPARPSPSRWSRWTPSTMLRRRFRSTRRPLPQTKTWYTVYHYCTHLIFSGSDWRMDSLPRVAVPRWSQLCIFVCSPPSHSRWHIYHCLFLICSRCSGQCLFSTARAHITCCPWVAFIVTR